MYYEDGIEIDDWYRNKFKWISQFINRYESNKQSLSDEEIEYFVEEMRKGYQFQFIPNYYIREFIQSIKEEDFKRILCYIFRDNEKYQSIDELLEASDLIKYGLEIEVAHFYPTKFEILHETGALRPIMQVLGIPDDISDSIIDNIDYGKRNKNNRWTISKESSDFLEISTPILNNSLEDINKIVAVCTLLKALGAELNGGTGLHINIGVDYLECNSIALDNVLKIWMECEELFYKIANQEGTVIRVDAKGMVSPVADGIQKYFEKDGSVQLNSDEEKEEFLFQVQANKRLERILYSVCMEGYEYWESDDPDERRQAYHEYYKYIKEHPEEDDPTRWTSINYNHMEWNDKESPGRVEIRIFNSSLDINTILEDLFLTMKLFEVSLKNAKDPEYKKEEFQKLFRRDVSEETKLDSLLDLLFDKEEHKQIYKRRWESVRNNEAYEFTKGSEPTFIREE